MSNYTLCRTFLMALEPVHIGAGGYRLGRVDMTIVREPGTNLPKIPGTSLAGAARSYAAMQYGKPQAAGQHTHLPARNRDRSKCPIIYTFGTTTEADGGQAGCISFGDARLLFAPVNSMRGPVWVTTSSLLKEVGIKATGIPDPLPALATSLAIPEKDAKQLNLGWMLFDNIAVGVDLSWPGSLPEPDLFSELKKRVAIVSENHFSIIVNSNLEVRTSVSIDPDTGAAKQGALFTYEAIPRASWFWSDLVEDNYNTRPFPQTSQKFLFSEETDEKGTTVSLGQDGKGDDLGQTWQRPLDVALSGLRLAEYLGVGGMGTRGFGRLKLVASMAGKEG